MAFAASIDEFLKVLNARAPAKVDDLVQDKRRVRHGLLSVGLKLHCLGGEDPLRSLVDALGGDWRVLNRNVYRRSRADCCLVLPPVGSAHSAILLLEAIEQYSRCSMFNNPDIQLQVCSPGRLSPRNAALHAIGFYLSSDTLRQYDLEDFATTVSEDFHRRGKRLVIYDAGPYGDFDGDFAWWARTADGLVIRPSLPFLGSRTDILVGPGSRTDIHGINLLATLLVHAQSQEGDGYWASAGQSFIRDMQSLLERHLLAGLIDASWVCTREAEGAAIDLQFYSAMQELMSYAKAEATRLSRGAVGGRRWEHERTQEAGGILQEIQVLMKKYRAIVTSAAENEQGDLQ